MNAPELLQLGLEFFQEGRSELAMELWKKASQMDRNFGPAYLNMYNVYRTQGNIVKAKEQLQNFLNCPLTGFSIDSVPRIKAELSELEKQIAQTQEKQSK